MRTVILPHLLLPLFILFVLDPVLVPVLVQVLGPDFASVPVSVLMFLFLQRL